jgi:endonuclease/exonuclease/phosphatase family metal-dependent hydrolase
MVANYLHGEIETGSFAPRDGFSHSSRRIRVVNWNIARGCQLDAVADFLVATNADLILLQEVDKHARRTAHRNIAEYLAQKLRFNYAFGIEFQELAQGSRDAPAFHGQATLSRWPLTDCRVLRFHRQSSFWHPRRWMPPLPQFQRRLGGRMALLSQARIGERTFVIYNLHLESRGGDDLRRSQLAEVLKDTLRYEPGVPILVGGDLNFNLTANCNACLLGKKDFHNPFVDLEVPTARSRWLARRSALDWILTRGPLTAISTQVDGSVSASDHYPLCLTLELAPRL